MYSCLEVPPGPGDPFSAFVPSFAFGLVCLSSLESLKNTQITCFAQRGCAGVERKNESIITLFSLGSLSSFLHRVSLIPEDGDVAMVTYFGGRGKRAYGKATNLKAWMTTVPNKMNKAEKMRDRRGIISRLQITTDVFSATQRICIYIWVVIMCSPMTG